MTTRKAFLATTAAFAATLSGRARTITPERGLLVRFLGSGASGWKPEWGRKNPHMRRQSSLLVENRVLFDFTPCSFDKLPVGCRPADLFVTHSHGDHFNPAAIVKSGVARVFTHESWATAARTMLQTAAQAAGGRAPEVIGLAFARPVKSGDLTITAVPANHSTSRITDGVLERPSLYLVERGETRLLYATDTANIPADAARMIGIDQHINKENHARFVDVPEVHAPCPITALIMEATNGDLDDDFRLFTHASVPEVDRTVQALLKTGRFTPPAGQRAYLTHLGIKYRGWPSEKIEAEIPSTLAAAYDGLEIRLG